MKCRRQYHSVLVHRRGALALPATDVQITTRNMPSASRATRQSPSSARLRDVGRAWRPSTLTRVEFVDENGGGPGVRLRTETPQKGTAAAMPNNARHWGRLSDLRDQRAGIPAAGSAIASRAKPTMLEMHSFCLEAHRTSARHYACGSGLLPTDGRRHAGVPERVVAPEPRLARIGLGIMRVVARHPLCRRFTGITPPLGSLQNWHRGLSRLPRFTGCRGLLGRGTCVTFPTVACPPSLADTCCTVTFCSPPVRYRLSASICGM